MSIRVAIVGPTSYTAYWLIEILLRHPGAAITYLATQRDALPNIADEFPQLRARFEMAGRPIDPAAMIEQSARLLLTRYLRPTGGVSIPAGGWIDAFDADGRPTAKTMPASTFYHLFMALAEARRALGAGN